MTLEVEGAPAAPTKSQVPGHQTTAASWLNCFWVDAFDFLQSYMWGQQPRLLSLPPDPRSFQKLSYAFTEPQTGKEVEGRVRRRDVPQQRGPSSQALEATETCKAPASRFRRRVRSDLDCPAGAGVLMCREGMATLGVWLLRGQRRAATNGPLQPFGTG